MRVGTGTKPIQILNSTCSMGGCGSRGGWGTECHQAGASAAGATFKHPHVKLLVIGMEGCEQIRKTQDEPQWIVTQRLLSHLQYLDSVKSSAKDLSLPRFEIMISCKTFDGRSSSYATGPRPNDCHVTMEAVDNTA